jgi:hypothetical protein
MLWPDDSHIVAVASDVPLDELPVPRLDLGDPAAIVHFILNRTGLAT